ncbi:hypothetical protein AGMMS49521_4530 [Campylobacterota bacterium]|nr:hypothetical protein AGMMS49521_4530 [Campylobacterota bacterium]
MIVLSQTDTTVGLLSHDPALLNRAKGRSDTQPVIRTVKNLAVLREFVRVPAAHKNAVRRARKTTFIFPNRASLRVITGQHRAFFDRIKWIYSTSANKTGEPIDIEWAKTVSDVWVIPAGGLICGAPSAIYKLSKTNVKRVR